jgi:Tfp pilus assembly protein PilO
MKLSKEKQQHLIAVVIGAVVVVVALYFLVITGQQEKLTKLDKEIGAATNQINAAQADIRNEKVKLDMLSESTNRLAQLEKQMMPTNEVYSTFLSTFTQFRSQFGATVEIADIGKDKPAPLGMLPKFPYGTAVFTVRGWAYYHDFGRFMSELESQHPFYRVKQFSLVAGALMSPDPEKLQFEMEIVTLVRPNP